MFERITITGLDKESITKNNAFSEAYSSYINLSRRPERVWKEIFCDVFANAFYGMKRAVTVVDDKLLLVYAVSDNMQKQIDFLKTVVEDTNNRNEIYLQKEEVKRTRERELKQQEEEIKNKMKNEFDSLTF